MPGGAGGGGWTNVVPILILNSAVFIGLGRLCHLFSPPEFAKRSKQDVEFNKYLHLRFNKAVQDPDSIAGAAVKKGCRPEFRPFDSPTNPVVATYGWNDEIQPYESFGHQGGTGGGWGW
eukprot:CAMPEP_0174285116 /NCGR_PEP_ID=MMETSP0809-20121228/7692_1 /TAXON_ID=73025 ORGANISM="Eutreptiella gymnastica-like, Strain CCMP1594" /NCGR_SAMPLE_ID=MMETSP0809 /ASSEMBLY_ACC=CAM_ASM_000658 /LENGTH=118 /DNA_ID=CAMNT_0015380807 /DNA_START=22 /DNA_END=375 /DNA_ORIENTATION=-